MPTFAPELRYGRGHPGPVGDARSLRRRLAEEDLAAERAGLVHDVDRGVDDDHAAEGDAGYLEKAREMSRESSKMVSPSRRYVDGRMS